MRIGHGYDAHRFAEGRPLILGGITVPHSRGLLGHSDADVLTHAITDALLGAAGLPDIGQLFPASDKSYEGICSLRLLERACEKIADKGYAIGNIDATIIAQEPKLAEYLGEMTGRIARTLCVSRERVNVKATTEEGMGFTGRREGIAAHCVVLLTE